MGELDHHSTTANDATLAGGALDIDEAFTITDGDLHSLSGSSYCHHHDMALLDCTTIVTDAADVDDGEFDSAPAADGMDGEGDDHHDEQECDDDDQILNCNDDDEVPAEVKVSFWGGRNDNDDSTTRHDRRGHEVVVGDDSAEEDESSSSSSSSDCSGSEEEEEEDESEEEEGGEGEVMDGDEADEVGVEEVEEEDDSGCEAEDGESEDDDDSVGEYETDEDSIDDANRDPMEDDESSCSGSTSRRPLDDVGDDPRPRHELFLPPDASPTTELLKYEEDDEEEEEDDDSSDEDSVDGSDRDDYRNESRHYPQRTYIIGQNNRNSGRPRMWDGCPSIASISSSSSSSSGSSQGSRSISSSSTSSKKKRKKSSEGSGRRGVTFNDSVTVYPVFKTAVYTSTMVTSMYTKREELRLNKIRNKREFAYELYDWRNAAEEEEMETNDRGELMHPVHAAERGKCGGGMPPSPRNVVQTYSSALGGYIVGSMSGPASTYRAKRARIYYP
jgi:hypothetical protein